TGGINRKRELARLVEFVLFRYGGFGRLCCLPQTVGHRNPCSWKGFDQRGLVLSPICRPCRVRAKYKCERHNGNKRGMAQPSTFTLRSPRGKLTAAANQKRLLSGTWQHKASLRCKVPPALVPVIKTMLVPRRASFLDTSVGKHSIDMARKPHARSFSR